ncbi:hypothetical protein C2125_00095 [Rahnella aquatilis]|nr:iron chelate uptake ABC transporter family permease subunit [Rahnella aquatilis]RBQ35875.1 hypothetical protein C2125_00095 [Rahnella aquatilis]
MTLSAEPAPASPLQRARLLTPRRCFILSLLLLLAGIIYSLTIGRYPVSFGRLMNFIGSDASAPDHALLHNIIIDSRLPRIVAAVLVVAIVLLAAIGRVLDVMTLSEDEAYSLGVPVRFYRYGIIILATLISALTVSIAGMVGWVGLLIPHLTRLLVGAGNVWLLPVAVCLGGCFLLLCDGLARTLAPGEIPLGIITELLGALAFIALLKTVRRGWA